MSAKAPIYLKRRSRRGKKEKLRDILSSDMISPPLGDFRHTIHIGSGGGSGEDDLFGDLSFLQGKFHLLPGQQGRSLSQRSSMYADGDGEPFEFGRTASVGGRLPSAESSPLLKNALSLPVIGGVQAITLPLAAAAPPTAAAHPPPQSSAPPPKPPRLHLDDKAAARLGPSSPPSALSPCGRLSGFGPPLPRFSSADDVCIQDPYVEVEDESQEEGGSYMSNAGSLLSLHLDLGPSMLDDVLQIMDGQRLSRLTNACLQEIYT